MNYTEVTRRHCLEILDLHEGTDIDERAITAAAQTLRPAVTREEVADALAWLRLETFAEMRTKPLLGRVWRITRDGAAAIRSLQ